MNEFRETAGDIFRTTVTPFVLPEKLRRTP